MSKQAAKHQEVPILKH